MQPAARPRFRRAVKAFASLKLAVVIVLALGALSAWGTFVEAKYNDAAAAQRIVYKSIWMYATMGMLAVSLTAVMVDRWPWQRKHLGFVLAHIGILTLMFGALLTQRFGVDGSIAFGIGQSSRLVSVGETDFAVYSSLDGESYAKMFDQEVDFFSRPPTNEKPVSVPLPEGSLEVVDYLPYAYREEKIVTAASPDRDAGAAVRFQLQNDRVNMTDWIQQSGKLKDAVKDLGPAKIVLTRQDPPTATEGNAIVLRPTGSGDELAYEIRTARDPKAIKRGKARAGDAIETGWMGLVFRVLKSMPSSETSVAFKKAEASSPLTTSAVKIRFRGQDRWLGLNSVLKLFSENAVYVATYGNRRIDLGFDLKLEKFSVGRYQGTMRAASYESVVDVPGQGATTISMNEPLKYKGFTFYQASFNEDEQGKPIASILSVNRDPGRWLKYLGSLLIVFGSAYMFWFKRAALKKASVAGRSGVAAFFAIGAFILAAAAAPADALADPQASTSTDAIKYLPVQEGGRVKPFDSFARETLQLVYGRQSFKSASGLSRPAHEVVMTWMLAPQFWEEEKLIQISHQGLKDALSLPQDRKHFSPAELLRSERLPLAMQDLASHRETKEKLSPYYQAAQSLESALGLFQAIKSGKGLHPMPAASGDKWRSVAELDGEARDRFMAISRAFIRALPQPGASASSSAPDSPSLGQAVSDFVAFGHRVNAAAYENESAIATEVHYNDLRPFMLSWGIYLAAALALAVAWQRRSKIAYGVGWTLALSAFALHTYGFGLRVYLTHRPPVSNMYESVVWVSWGAVLFALMFEFLRRKRYALLSGCSVGVICLVVADMAPAILDDSLQPLEPVLRSNYWLTIHVLTITLSYSAFFLGWGLSVLGLGFVLRGDSPTSERVREIVQSLYRSLQVGTVLLAAGTILGGVWADYSWGRFWGWDPKETWAFIALMGYIAILHGRLSGWIQGFGLLASSIASFSLVIMAWYGVNYVLGAGLHTYGFGAGGVQYVAGFVILNFIYVGYVAFVRWQREKSAIEATAGARER